MSPTADSLLLGLLIGSSVMLVICLWSMHSYRATLLHCAQQQSCEKLSDGKFYYLVPESQYNAWNLAELARQQEQTKLEQQLTAVTHSQELDAAGIPKLELTVLESEALKALNLVKAWADSDRSTAFPEEAHMGADLVLNLAQLRRKGVQ